MKAFFFSCAALKHKAFPEVKKPSRGSHDCSESIFICEISQVTQVALAVVLLQIPPEAFVSLSLKSLALQIFSAFL